MDVFKTAKRTADGALKHAVVVLGCILLSPFALLVAVHYVFDRETGYRQRNTAIGALIGMALTMVFLADGYGNSLTEDEFIVAAGVWGIIYALIASQFFRDKD